MHKRFKVFLSHIHEEKDMAIALKTQLEELYLGAIEIFVSSDETTVRGGDRWLQVIEEKLKDSDLILVLASPQSIKRPWINFEAGGAWFMNKKVIPLCILGMSPATLPEPLHSLQSRNIEDSEDLKRLLYDISSSAGLRVPNVPINVLHRAIFPPNSENENQESNKINSDEPLTTIKTEQSRRGLVEANLAVKELLSITSKLVPEVNKSINKVNDQVARFDSAATPAQQHKIATLIASHLRNGAAYIEKSLPGLNETIDVAIEFTLGYRDLQDSNIEDDRERLINFRQQLAGVLDSTRVMLDSMRSRRNNVLKLGVISKDVNNASRQMGQALMGIASSFEQLDASWSKIIKSIDEILSNQATTEQDVG